MNALVPELVEMASDAAVPTSDLLRRSLVVAKRLDITDIVEWINNELIGYSVKEVPSYRRIRGQLVAHNPMRGMIPFIAPPEITDTLADFSLRQSVPELMHLAQSKTGLFTHFPPEIEQKLMEMMRAGSGVAMQPSLKFSTIQISGVIETVRSRILSWALELESSGILGEGKTFTQQEKKLVQEQHYHFGDVTGSQIQIGSHSARQNQVNSPIVDAKSINEMVEAFLSVLDRRGVAGPEEAELRAELATLKAQAGSPKPKWEVIQTTARSIKTIAEGAAANILGELAKPHVATLLSLIGL